MGVTSRLSDLVHPSQSAREAVTRVCRSIVGNPLFVGSTTLLTVWVLLIEDLKIIFMDRDADLIIGFFGVACIIIFTIEIVLSSVGKDDYFWGFFFWLDVLSTASLILDLPWISDEMNSTDGDDSGSMSQGEMGRTGRLGARSARMVRVIRLVRIAKLYKAFYESTKAKVRKRQGAGQHPGSLEMDDEDDILNESRVGKKLSDLTTRRVIILVLTMLIVLPQLEVDAIQKLPTSANYGADEVMRAWKLAGPRGDESHKIYQRTLLRYIYFHNWFSGNNGCPENKGSNFCPHQYLSHVFWIGFARPGDGENTPETLERLRLSKDVVDEWVAKVNKQNDVFNFGPMPEAALELLTSEWKVCTGRYSSRKTYGFSLLSKKAGGITWPVDCYFELRPTERVLLSPWNCEYEEKIGRFDFGFDDRLFSQTEAWWSIITTVFVCIVLCSAAMIFYNDVNELVLFPVEQMINKVQAIRQDPLKAISLAEQAYAKEVRNLPGADRGGSLQGDLLSAGGCSTSSRMRKIRQLLACSKPATDEPMETVILEKTIIKLGSLLALGFGEAGAQIIGSNLVNTSFGVNVMVPGQRVECVISHARIQDFSVVTEVLDKRVMTFVNQVAEIVHGVVEEQLGSANRNNGDTFLIVWRQKDNSMPDADSKHPELALYAMAKIIGSIHRSRILAEYRGHPGLQNKLGSTYQVHLTCGIHAGWAIEGAVGSEYKIEASYLSPNVAVAMAIETSSEIYNASCLATEAVVEKCSADMRSNCRLIDRIMVPGCRSPMNLYVIDLAWTQLRVESASAKRTWRARDRMKARQFLEIQKNSKEYDSIGVMFENDTEIGVMRRKLTEPFFEIFKMGYQNYKEGEWQVAKRFLEETCVMLDAVDGPSWALIRFMEMPYGFEAPVDWKGVHDLTPMLQGATMDGLGETSTKLLQYARMAGFSGGRVLSSKLVL